MTPATISLKNAKKRPPPPFPDHYCHTQTQKKLSEKTGEDRSLPETDIYPTYGRGNLSSHLP